jgi:DNA-directed RNA polymerase beta subunit
VSLSDKKLHARSTGPYTSTLLTPSHGKKRDGGQQIGEYDAYSLLAWDCPIVLDEFFGSLSSDHKTKNEIIAEIIQTGEGSFKASKSNPVKDLFNAYMLAIHLQSE